MDSGGQDNLEEEREEHGESHDILSQLRHTLHVLTHERREINEQTERLVKKTQGLSKKERRILEHGLRDIIDGSAIKKRPVLSSTQIEEILLARIPEKMKRPELTAAVTSLSKEAVNDKHIVHLTKSVAKIKLVYANPPQPKSTPTPIDPVALRKSVFDSYEVELRERLRKNIEGNGTTLSSDQAAQLKLFCRDFVSWRRDGLFVAADNGKFIPTATDGLLIKFPQLKNIVQGALLAKAIEEQSRASQSSYRSSLSHFNPEQMKAVIHAEQVQLIVDVYSKELTHAGITGPEADAKKQAFETAVKQELNEGKNKNFMQEVEKRIKQRGNYQDTGFAFNKTMRHYLDSPLMQRSTIEAQNITTVIAQAQQQRITQAIPAPLPPLHPPSYTPPPSALGSALNFSAQLFNRVFTVTRTARTVSTIATTATAATTAPAWLPIALLVIVIGALILIIISTVLPTSTVTEPYPIMRTPTQAIGISGTPLSPTPISTPPAGSPSASLSIRASVEKAAALTDVPVAVLLAISKNEAGVVWNYSEEEFQFYNTYLWWKNLPARENEALSKVKKGYGYDTCTGIVPSDTAVVGGLQAARAVGCANYSDGTKSHVMGAMQFNIKTWEGYAPDVKRLQGYAREPDRRVIDDITVAAGLFMKKRVPDKGKEDEWSVRDFIKAAGNYHGSCPFKYGNHTGNYCYNVCVTYKELSGSSINCDEILQITENR